jgi:threonine/homoserine efflux transporter RhtA
MPGRRARLSCRAVDRNTVMWTLVVFFGASLMFSTIRDASEGEGIGVALAAQIAAGLLLVAFIVLYMRRRP